MTRLELVPTHAPDAQRDPLTLYPTQHPCPAWCRRPHGHGYRYGLLEGHEDRYHRAHTADLVDLSQWALSLRVTQVEVTHGPSRSETTLLPASVDLGAPGDVIELDQSQPAIQLRLLAQRLFDAAAALPAMDLGGRA